MGKEAYVQNNKVLIRGNPLWPPFVLKGLKGIAKHQRQCHTPGLSHQTIMLSAAHTSRSARQEAGWGGKHRSTGTAHRGSSAERTKMTGAFLCPLHPVLPSIILYLGTCTDTVRKLLHQQPSATALFQQKKKC